MKEEGHECSHHLRTYAEGWTKGDAATILRSVCDDYTCDDPNVGKIARRAFSEYLEKLKQNRAFPSRWQSA